MVVAVAGCSPWRSLCCSGCGRAGGCVVRQPQTRIYTHTRQEATVDLSCLVLASHASVNPRGTPILRHNYVSSCAIVSCSLFCPVAFTPLELVWEGQQRRVGVRLARLVRVLSVYTLFTHIASLARRVLRIVRLSRSVSPATFLRYPGPS